MKIIVVQGKNPEGHHNVDNVDQKNNRIVIITRDYTIYYCNYLKIVPCIYISSQV